jgi:hypothetical protein
MHSLTAILIFLFASIAHAAWIEGSLGESSVPMTELNAERSDFKWNGTTSTVGELKNPSYFSAGLSGHFLFHTRLGFIYESQTKQLAPTDIPSASYSVSDSFVYRAVITMLEVPFRMDGFMLTLGAGCGYAIDYQFHQKESGVYNEDVTWQSHPMVVRARASLGYNLTHHFGIFGEAIYESVSSTLTAAKDYQSTSGGSTIRQGQFLTNPNTDANVQADLSGMRYGLGIRLMF